MPKMSIRHARGARAVAGIIATGLLAAACSSSGGGAPNAAAPNNATHPASTSAVVMTRSGPDGTFLTDGSGKALYMFASDTSTKSSCSGQCLTYWPVFGGKVKAGAGVQSGKLASITTGGTQEATYAGHPLHYYAGDRKAGDISGQGRDDFGAKWWLLSPAGEPITKTAANGGSDTRGYGGG